jgi:outer membrane protein assembly factor BamB
LNRATTCASWVVLCWLASSPVFAESWWQFRGPGGQGHAAATGLPAQWSPEENVTWYVPLAGEGWSSPVYDEGELVLTAAVPIEGGQAGDLALRVICLRASDGSTLWETDVFEQLAADSPPIHSKNSHASPTPLIQDDQIYVHFGHQGTACLDRQGKVVWKTREFGYNPVHGNGGSPVLYQDLLIFHCDGGSDPFLVALDRKTGAMRWRVGRSTEAERNFSFATPMIIDVAGQPQLISPASDAVFAYDPATGEEIWRVNYPGGYSVIPRPVHDGGLVYVCTGYGQPHLLAIRPDGRGDVTESHVAWRLQRGAPHTPSLLLVDGRVYLVSDAGVASCLDAETGERLWQERLEGGFSASPLYADGRIYFQNEEGVAFVIAPGDTFHLLARNDLRQRTLASYAVAENALFIRTANGLFRIE